QKHGVKIAQYVHLLPQRYNCTPALDYPALVSVEDQPRSIEESTKRDRVRQDSSHSETEGSPTGFAPSDCDEGGAYRQQCYCQEGSHASHSDADADLCR